MGVPVLINETDHLPLVPGILEQRRGEFCVSQRLDAEFVGACCRLGYLPMSDMYEEMPLLLIKCHRERMVLRFPDLHLSGSTRRRIRREELLITVDQHFEDVLATTSARHSDSWFTDALCRVFTELHREPREGVSVHSVELITPTGEVVAAELGYRCGRAYTSLSGFHDRSGTGAIQLVALGRLLEQQQFAFWDLGMQIPYKRKLGARPVERHTFLEEYRRVAKEPPALFPLEPRDCRELLADL